MGDICPTCKHSLENNSHGFDQNDGYLDENGKLVLYGTCTYCRLCWSEPAPGDSGANMKKEE